MPVLEALGETGVEPHVVCFGVALLKGVCRRRFRRNAQLRGAELPVEQAEPRSRVPQSPVAAQPLLYEQACDEVFFSCVAIGLSLTSHNEQFSGQELCGIYGLALYELLLSARAAMCVYGFCLNVAFCGFFLHASTPPVLHVLWRFLRRMPCSAMAQQEFPV